MADAQTQAPDSSTDIASLAGGSGSPFDGLDYKKSIADLTDLKRKQVKEETDAMGKTDVESDRMLHNAEYFFRQEGVGPNNVPKAWDANKEHEKFESNPIEGLGSVGGIFATIASAFTKAPMTNAINGMAGAINSIKEGNEAAYTRAYESYKENVKLALERQKIQHEQYQDAVELLKTNMAAGQAKLHNLATKYGDQQALTLLEHGMDPQLMEMFAARAKAADQMAQYDENTTKRTFQKAAVAAIAKNPPQTGDPVQDKMQLAAQIQRVYDGGSKYGSAEQEAVGKFVMSHQNDQTDKFVEGLREIHEQFTPKAVNIEGYRQAVEEYRASHQGQDPPAEENAKLQQQFGLGQRPLGGGTGMSSQANKTKAVEEIMVKHKAEGKEITRAEAEREYKQTIQIPTAHDQHSDDISYQKVERMEGAISKVDDLLTKHKFMTGIGGTLTRPVEAIGNILGSTETDRKQFERDVLEIKEWGQQVLNDRTGRPLSSEASDAGKIFAGLKPGDTTANTLRAYMELRPLLAKIKEHIKARGQGRGPVSGAGSTEPASTEGKGDTDAPWLRDPVKP